MIILNLNILWFLFDMYLNLFFCEFHDNWLKMFLFLFISFDIYFKITILWTV